MTVLECSSRLELKNYPFVLIHSTLPSSSPNHRAAFTPVRDNIVAEHISLNGFGIHQRIPTFSLEALMVTEALAIKFLFIRNPFSTSLSFQVSPPNTLWINGGRSKSASSAC